MARPQRNWCLSLTALVDRPTVGRGLPRSRCCLCAIRGRSPRVPSPPLAQPGPNPPTPARALFESCQRPLIDRVASCTPGAASAGGATVGVS